MTDVLIRHDRAVREIRPDRAQREAETAVREHVAVLPCQLDGAADLFFSERPAELEEAKQLCADCPLRRECLDGALARREPWGVWGGSIFAAGEVIAVKRPRGRPRKNAA